MVNPTSIGYIMTCILSGLLQASSLHSDSLAYKGAAAIFTTAFAIWDCRNDVIFYNSRASQTKVKLYLTELLSASLKRIVLFW